MTRLVSFIATGALAALAWSYLGALHPVGDSLAVFRVALLVGAALAVIWTGWGAWLRWPIAAICSGLIVWHLVQRGDFRDPLPGGGDVTLYQQNLWGFSPSPPEFYDHLQAMNPDIITLQELSRQHRPLFNALAEDYEASLFCPVTWIGEAIISRFPKVPGSDRCSAPDGFAAMQVVTPKGPVWTVSVHLHWPWPRNQAEQVTQLLPYLAELEGPVIMAGDFNAVAWSYTLRRMADAAGVRRVGAHLHSFGEMPVPMHLGIDHVLVTQGEGRLQQMPRFASDHFGLWAEVSLPD